MKDDMTKDQFTRLFKYMTTRFDVIDAKLDLKADKSDVWNAIDSLHGRLDVVETELVAIKYDLRRNNNKQENHERRIVKLEKKNLGTV